MLCPINCFLHYSLLGLLCCLLFFSVIREIFFQFWSNVWIVRKSDMLWNRWSIHFHFCTIINLLWNHGWWPVERDNITLILNNSFPQIFFGGFWDFCHEMIDLKFSILLFSFVLPNLFSSNFCDMTSNSGNVLSWLFSYASLSVAYCNLYFKS